MTRSLLAERSFLLLWLGQSVSYLGTQASALALPLTAITLLDASPFQMGVLVALNRAPYLVVGLPIGVLVDRVRRRSMVLVANALLAATLAVVPLAHWQGWLSLLLLYAVAVATGTWAVMFDVAYLALVPEVVAPHHLTGAQSLIEVTQSLGQLAGPAAAGWLVAVASGPAVIGLDAVTYVVAVVTVALVGGSAAPVRRRPGVVFEIGEGIGAVMGQPTLRSITLANATFYFWLSGYLALLALYLVEVGASPGQIGLVVAVGSAGGLLGAAVAGTVGNRLGIQKTLGLALVVGGLSAGVLPVATSVAGVGGAAVALAGSQLAQQTFNVHQVPFRYRLTPLRTHGRVNAVVRTITWGGASLGALLGGSLGAGLGLAPALALCGTGAAAASLWIHRRDDQPEL